MSSEMSNESKSQPGLDFVRQAVVDDLASKRFSKISTRFPPEPNGYLHIGHAKAICTDFGIANEYQGNCNLRFDDTNPSKEEQEYVDGIKFDVHWLGFDWQDRLFFASDYFGQLYEWALLLVDRGLAYVDDQSSDQISKGRGTPTEPGVNSPFRDRSVAENRRLFEAMKNGECAEGSHVLRAKIDMTHPNLIMRDPVMYRIKFDHHHRTGNTWCIYPMYDWAHGQSDAIEGISHSICTLEFENHRPLYEWFLEALGLEHKPRQIEFNRLNLTYTMMSKRKLLELVELKLVESWDDPRMPTISGMRRRGFTAKSIRDFVGAASLTKTDGMIELAMLEYFVRQDLNAISQRRMVVLDPVKLIIENYPTGKSETVGVENNPESLTNTERPVYFSREVYVEREDFMEEASKKWYRLAPGQTVRLKGACYVTCTGFTKGADGRVETITASYEPESMGGGTGDGRKVKGTIHWVSCEHSLDVTLNQYSTLFTCEDLSKLGPDEDFKTYLNPQSVVTIEAKAEFALADARIGDYFQFMRQGYYTPDSKKFVSIAQAHTESIAQGSLVKPNLVFNRTVTLKDTWSKLEKRGET